VSIIVASYQLEKVQEDLDDVHIKAEARKDVVVYTQLYRTTS